MIDFNLRFDHEQNIYFVGNDDVLNLLSETGFDVYDNDSEFVIPSIVKNNISKLYDELNTVAAELELPQTGILFLSSDDSSVGKFIYGTENITPLIVVYIKELEHGTNSEEELLCELRITLFHELGHAYIFSMYPDIVFDDYRDVEMEEEICESFGRFQNVKTLRESVKMFEMEKV